ncbi:hypothetical protein LMH87_002044 [Akanthomyces muscarius]|uniref:Uncharacterized protein n=1 Tax=Akanthomyces muscarius TaxID=2231603 RepID=A0A9W8UIV2_AKAMU|nr:hypothetical protein LMH87_002044 [Akanthomyces muscarius]KAJ4147532.1 hypothetical protein LMH87_002044 [Akanthomyces muscarius]
MRGTHSIYCGSPSKTRPARIQRQGPRSSRRLNCITLHSNAVTRTMGTYVVMPAPCAPPRGGTDCKYAFVCL